MKKVFKLILILMAFLVCNFIFQRYYSSNLIPTFNYRLTNNKSFTNKDLKEERIVVFIYFSPECLDCRIINNYIDYFKSKSETIDFVLIAKANETSRIINFIDIKKMSDFRGYLLLDKKDDFPSDFALGISYSYPTVKAYDKSGVLMSEVKTLEDIKKI